MPLFKFKKSQSKKVPLKSSSMGNLYKDYGGGEAIDDQKDKRSSWENEVASRNNETGMTSTTF